jgi:hypothetical protein
MEISNQPSARESRKGLWVLLLAVVAAVLTAYVPVFLIITPALWAYAGARTKPYWVFLPAAAFAYGMFSFEPAAVASALTAGALAATLLLLLLLTRGFSNSETVLILCGAFLLTLYGAICLPSLLDGKEAFAAIQSRVGDLRALYRASEAQMSQISPDSIALILQTMDAMYDAVPAGFVAVLCVFASVLGLGNLLFFRAFCRKQAQIKLSPMRAFRDWTLPRSMTLGLFALLIGSIILELSGWTFAESFSITVNTLLGIPLFLQGICVVDFLISRMQKNHAVVRTIMYTGFGVLYQLVIFPLVLIGCFDQIFRIRERMRSMPPPSAA